jgi:uncharacterized DUF497 family protein
LQKGEAVGMPGFIEKLPINFIADWFPTGKTLQIWRSEGMVEWLGYKDNMPEEIAKVIVECLWLDKFVDKIIKKHNVSPEEVEEVFSMDPTIRRLEGGHVKGEDLFIAFGRTDSGRYLSVLFVLKKGKRALVISARDMTKGERKKYGKK